MPDRPNSELPAGLYEAILTEYLRSRLPGDERLYRLAKLDGADGPGVLADHLARVVEKVLSAPQFDRDLAAQVALAI